jgi:hypothetical protein
MGNQRDGRERLARCCCGNLKVTARGEPVDVYLCSCTDCQRGAGSVLLRCHISRVRCEHCWREAGVQAARRLRTLRRQLFCPTCGTAVLFRAEGLPGTLGVPVGCFADPSFARLSKLFWASRQHHWLELPASIAVIDTQLG